MPTAPTHRASRSGERTSHHHHPELSHSPGRPDDPGRLLFRQRQRGAGAAGVSPRQMALARTAGRRRRQAGGHRHRAVHAPACRSRRLEHAARQRPLGADVSQRALSDLAPRMGSLAGGGCSRAVAHGPTSPTACCQCLPPGRPSSLPTSMRSRRRFRSSSRPATPRGK